MSKNHKIKATTKPQDNVTATKLNNKNTQLVISYLHLCLNNKKYSLESVTDNRKAIFHYEEYFNKINEYCKFDNFKKKIVQDKLYSKRNHIHPIDWSDNRIKENSFSCLNTELMEQIRDDCWQLGIDNDGFRVHGFFIDNVFYVVWLDPNHELYERK